jgi:hypothetical protein
MAPLPTAIDAELDTPAGRSVEPPRTVNEAHALSTGHQRSIRMLVKRPAARDRSPRTHHSSAAAREHSFGSLWFHYNRWRTPPVANESQDNNTRRPDGFATGFLASGR